MAVRAFVAAVVLCTVAPGCGGETFVVGLCPSPGLTARGGAVLERVAVLRVGFQEVEGDSVVSEEIVQGSADGFSVEGVSESDASLSIWAEGLESADATRPLVTGSTNGTVRISGLRPVCICVAEPAEWEGECRGVPCTFDGGECTF
jgi:hypothetical protein